MRFEVTGSGGRPVRAVRHGSRDGPTVLIAHGWKGFMDWGSFPWIADTLAAAGLGAVRFDFSHNGVEATDFDRLDLFLLDTPRRHQEDLQALLAATSGPVGLLGHSRGGADMLCCAATAAHVQCCATLASVPAWPTPSPAHEAELRGTGFLAVPNARTGQVMPVARAWFDAAELHDVQAHAARVRCPVLLTHGSSDESVPLEAMAHLQAACAHAETYAVEGAGHTFGAVHPWAGPTPHLTEVMAVIVPFFAKHLLGDTAGS